MRNFEVLILPQNNVATQFLSKLNFVPFFHFWLKSCHLKSFDNVHFVWPVSRNSKNSFFVIQSSNNLTICYLFIYFFSVLESIQFGMNTTVYTSTVKHGLLATRFEPILIYEQKMSIRFILISGLNCVTGSKSSQMWHFKRENFLFFPGGWRGGGWG